MTEEEKEAAVDRAVQSRSVYWVECDDCLDESKEFDWSEDAEELAEEWLVPDGRVLCDDCRKEYIWPAYDGVPPLTNNSRDHDGHG
jgi:hypothetical protein